MPYIDQRKPTKNDNLDQINSARGIWLALWLIFSSFFYTVHTNAQVPTEEEQATAEQAVPANTETALSTEGEATPVDAPPEAPPFDSRRTRNQSLLAKALPDEAQWLETPEGKVLALYGRTEARKTYGVLLMLHALSDPQDWPPEMENLRLALPKYGWETLSVALPPQYPLTIPPRPKTEPPPNKPDDEQKTVKKDSNVTEQNAETNTEEDPEPTTVVPTQKAAKEPITPPPSRIDLINSQVAAALQFLTEKNQYNVVLLVDNSSAPDSLATLLPQLKPSARSTNTLDGPFQALILINLQNQEALSIAQLEAIFSIPKLPIMDIFLAPNTADKIMEQQRHHGVAMRKKLENYVLSTIEPQPQATSQDTNSFLMQRVRGFMMRNAKGGEIKN